MTSIWRVALAMIAIESTLVITGSRSTIPLDSTVFDVGCDEAATDSASMAPDQYQAANCASVVIEMCTPSRSCVTV
jgi:hypothetical protein